MDKNLHARLEIRLSPEYLARLKAEAKEKSTSVGSLVRESIEQRYQITNEDRLKAVEKIAAINSPVSDWEQMKKEIESGLDKE